MRLWILHKLTALLLVIVCLLAPLHAAYGSVAGVKGGSACILQASCCPSDDAGSPADESTDQRHGCCDHEECCPDAIEPQHFVSLHRKTYGNSLLPTDIVGHVPLVYLPIYVPPEG